MEIWDQTLPQLFLRGGFVMWPILFCSMIGAAIILERALLFWWLRGSFTTLSRQLHPLLTAGQLEQARVLLTRLRDPLARVAAVYLENLKISTALRNEIVACEASMQLAKLERRLDWLGLIAHVAPLLGLLGTVTGLVGAFHQIEVRGGQVQPADLAAGIWEALLTTVFGLMVAVPCMIGYHWLYHRTTATTLQIEWLTAHLDEWLHQEPATMPDSGTGGTTKTRPTSAEERLANELPLGTQAESSL